MNKFKVFYFKEVSPVDPELKANLEVFKTHIQKQAEWYEVESQDLLDFCKKVDWGNSKERIILCGDFNQDMKQMLKKIAETEQESSICRNLTWNFNCEEASRIAGFDLSQQFKSKHLSCLDI